MNTRNKKFGNSKSKSVVSEFVRIKNKGQVTIPKKFCELLNGTRYRKSERPKTRF